MKVIILITLFLATQELIYEKELNNYICSDDRNSLSIDLKNHKILLNSTSFTITFWSKYQLSSNFPLFSFDSLKSKIVFGIDVKQNLIINNEKTLLGPLKASLNIYESNYFEDWNFFVIFLNRIKESDSFDFTVLVNNLKLQKNYSLKTDNEFLYLILGGNGFSSKCSAPSEFQQIIIYNNPESFTSEQITNISAEKAEIIFLSQFNREPSYNKFYSNLLDNQFGPIKNGVKSNSFAFFTSLSNSNNKKRIKTHLINDLSIFLLPDNLLKPRDVNQSYVFAMQFDFFYKDFKSANFRNTYNHVLYQRYSSEGVEILIRTDIVVNMGQIDNEITIRNFINEKIVSFKTIPLEMLKTDTLKMVPIKYILIKVLQNPLLIVPQITFENGYSNTPEEFKLPVKLEPKDKHLFGDNEQRKTTKKEYFSFINVKEILFMKGGFIKKNEKEGTIKYYSGFDNVDQVILCNNNNNPKRGSKGNLNLLTCEEDLIEKCKDINCDICEKVQCLICQPGYELIKGVCVKCTLDQGYDPMLKKCFEGKKVTDFFQTQFGNLIASTLNLEVNSEQILNVTLKFKMNSENLANKAFLFFLNNVDTQNKIIDMCFEECENKINEIYFASAEKDQIYQLKYLIFGNSASYAMEPISIIYQIKKNTDISLEAKFKNIDCSILSPKFSFKFTNNSNLFGECEENCSEGYFKDQRTNMCLRCPKNCRTCMNGEECLTCNDSEIIIDGKCQKCQLPCTRCFKEVNSCLACSQDDFFDEKKNNCLKKCNEMPQNCENCNFKTGQCANCLYGYSLRENICVLSVCNLVNCSTCSGPNFCGKCNMGYIVNNGLCELCKRNCEGCPIGYVLDFRKSCNLLNENLNINLPNSEIIKPFEKPFSINNFSEKNNERKRAFLFRILLVLLVAFVY